MAALSTVWWVRKGIRLHDNPALLKAVEGASAMTPLFVLDPHFLKPNRVGAARLRFLLESLTDLDASLRKRNSRLLVLHGRPEEVLPAVLRAVDARRLCFEWDSEPYALSRDAAVSVAAAAARCEVHSPVSHTFYDPRQVIAANKGKAPLTYTAFLKVVGKLAVAEPAADAPARLPPLLPAAVEALLAAFPNGIPTPQQLGYPPFAADDAVAFQGGETAGLLRLETHLARTDWVAAFEKPLTDPSKRITPLSTRAKPANPFEAAKSGAASASAAAASSAAAAASSAAAPPTAAAFLTPSTTGLSPYLKFGCVSARTFAARLRAIEAGAKKHSAPPVSLLGQLLWREFYYAVACGTPNYERMAGNPICRQIPWSADAALLAAWEEGRTGYPWIDACMTQLRTQGWMHHLARHSVACFLTRGDLWQSWEKGAEVFDRLLLDADPALNAGNWMWLSASQFFFQYFRVYSPVAFPKKYDANGDFVRHFLPALRHVPAKYIYEPWKMPADVQKAAGCVVGVDYPRPVVDHDVASKANMAKMAAAYAAHKAANGGGGGDDGEDEGEGGGPAAKKAKK